MCDRFGFPVDASGDVSSASAAAAAKAVRQRHAAAHEAAVDRGHKPLRSQVSVMIVAAFKPRNGYTPIDV
jgi:hypothetical protein